MMSLDRMPSRIARRVRTGRQSIARRRSSIGQRARDIGFCAFGGKPPPARFGGYAAAGAFGSGPGRRKAACMKLGVHIGYWGLGLTSEDQLEIVREAERLGYDSVWAAGADGSDAATILGWLAGQTERIKIGSAIFQMPARSPAMTAMTAATLDQLSGGRMPLGIGSSGPQVAEGWHGQRFGRQLQRTREYVAVVRKALNRERLEFHGETLDLPLPDGPGKALKLTIAPVQDH